MPKYKLSNWDNHYEEHCNNVAYLIRDIFEHVGMELHCQLSELLCQQDADGKPPTIEQIEAVFDETGRRRHDKLLQAARERAEAAISLYLETTDAAVQETEP